MTHQSPHTLFNSSEPSFEMAKNVDDYANAGTPRRGSVSESNKSSNVGIFFIFVFVFVLLSILQSAEN